MSRGGKRLGAGRKATGSGEYITVYVQKGVKKKYSSLRTKGINVSEKFTVLIDNLTEDNENEDC